MTARPLSASTTELLKSPVVVRALTAVIAGSFLLRSASSATGGMLAFFLAYLDQHRFPVSAVVVGFVAASFYATELIGAPLAGMGSDRLGRRLFMALGPFLGLVAVELTAILILLPHVTLLLGLLFLTRVLEGLSTAFNAPATLSYISAATATNPARRGKVIALFEMASLGGIAVGYLAGGFLWDTFHVVGFALLGIIYLLSTGLFWFGVHELPAELFTDEAEPTLGERLRLLTRPAILRLAPAWLAVNAVIGLWLSHAPFQMSGAERFPGQSLSGGFTGSQVGQAFALLILVFTAGIYFWGHALARHSRPRVMLWSMGGLFLTAVAVLAINHTPLEARGLVLLWMAVLLVGVLIASGFTPAALTYLADVSESYAAHRGAIMGVYSVLLALGQLIGGWIGGPFAHWRGIDGMLVLTFGLIGVTALTVYHLYTSHAQEVEKSKEATE